MECFQVMLFFYIFMKYNFDDAHGISENNGQDLLPQECPHRPRAITSPTMPDADDVCDPKIKDCDPSDFLYSIGGSCNNLESSHLGQVFLPFNRLVEANYADGDCAPRKVSVCDESRLPLPRLIRTTVLQEKAIRSSELNILFYGFGQFMTHDVTFQKPINSEDELRAHKGGSLKTANNIDEKPFPEIRSGSSCPSGGIRPEANGSCFLIGDARINLNPEISVMSILHLRMHNYIARRLHHINPHWEDDQLFKTARRILIAMYQIIVYKEHVPHLIGPELTSMYKLYPARTGYVDGYDPNIDPQTLHEYEAAAGRVLHSLIREEVPYQDSDGTPDKYLLRNKFYNQEFLLQKNIFLNIIKSYAMQQGKDEDTYFTDEVTNHLFFPSRKQQFGTDLPSTDVTKQFGTDLLSTDIMRGLDHGLPTFNQLREACNLPKFKSFKDMRKELKDPQDVKKLQSLYSCVDDLDLYVGGVLEKPLPGALLGPTLSCITAESFSRWKFGDRLFVEFPQAEFTPAQLHSIRKTTFAQILCAANPGLKHVYKHSFLIPSDKNPKIFCSAVPKINLELWREAPEFSDLGTNYMSLTYDG